jgi:hypothetical protein
MKKLTKTQRHEVYKKAHGIISKFTDNEAEFMCFIIERIVLDKFTISCGAEELPEFELFKPEEHAVAWFGVSTGFEGDNGRDMSYMCSPIKEAQKTILEFCIEMTKTK